MVLTAPGLAIAGAWSYGASAWGPLVLWEEAVLPVGAEDRSDWEAAVVFRGGAATADLIAAAARHRTAGIVASGSTDLRPGADLHRTTLEATPAPAVPTLLLYGHLAPTLPDRLLEALRPLAGTMVGMASADRSGAPELLLTGPAAEALAARVGPPVLAPGRDAVILGGRGRVRSCRLSRRPRHASFRVSGAGRRPRSRPRTARRSGYRWSAWRRCRRCGRSRSTGVTRAGRLLYRDVHQHRR